MKTILRIGIVIVLLCLIVMPVQAQDKEDTPYWYVSFYKVKWSKIDSFRTLVEKYTNPTVDEALKTGPMLDYKILLHHTGDEYNVVLMTKYPSWSAIDESSGMSAAFKKIQPDNEKRQEVYSAFNWALPAENHYDCIYTELTE